MRRLARSRALRKASIADSVLTGVFGLEFDMAGSADSGVWVIIFAPGVMGRIRDGLRTSHGKIGLIGFCGTVG